jgi:hypothetical protein
MFSLTGRLEKTLGCETVRPQNLVSTLFLCERKVRLRVREVDEERTERFNSNKGDWNPCYFVPLQAHALLLFQMVRLWEVTADPSKNYMVYILTLMCHRAVDGKHAISLAE